MQTQNPITFKQSIWMNQNAQRLGVQHTYLIHSIYIKWKKKKNISHDVTLITVYLWLNIVLCKSLVIILNKPVLSIYIC